MPNIHGCAGDNQESEHFEIAQNHAKMHREIRGASIQRSGFTLVAEKIEKGIPATFRELGQTHIAIYL